MALYTKTKRNTQGIVNTLRDYIDHLTVYISNDVGREREIKSATERRKLHFHISPADCSFSSSAGAAGTGLFSSFLIWQPCDFTVCGSPIKQKALFSIYTTSFISVLKHVVHSTFLWDCLSILKRQQARLLAFCHQDDLFFFFLCTGLKSNHLSPNSIASGQKGVPGRGLGCVSAQFP